MLWAEVALVNKRTKSRTLRAMQDPKREEGSPSPGRDAAGWPAGASGPSPGTNGNGEGMAVPVDAVLPTAGLGAPTRNPRRIPEATVARLPVYLRSLLEVADAKMVTISSERLAEMAGVNAAKVRKDLSYLGSYGTRGVGYDVQFLLSRSTGCSASPRTGRSSSSASATWATPWPTTRASRPAASASPPWSTPTASKVGEIVADLAVRHLDDLPAIAAEHDIAIGIVATPAGVGPGGGRPAGRGRRDVDPELRPRRDPGAPRACRSARSTCRSSCRSSPSTSSAGRRPRPRRPMATVGCRSTPCSTR